MPTDRNSGPLEQKIIVPTALASAIPTCLSKWRPRDNVDAANPSHETVFAQVVQQLDSAVGRARQCRGRPGAPDLAVVIDGRALVTALGADCKAKFLELGMACKVRARVQKPPELSIIARSGSCWHMAELSTIARSGCDSHTAKLLTVHVQDVIGANQMHVWVLETALLRCAFQRAGGAVLPGVAAAEGAGD